MATPLVSVPLPKGDRQYVRVVWARTTAPVKVVSYSRMVCGRWMHWGESHSEMCLRPDAECAWCVAGRKHLWYGWLLACDYHTRERVLLQMTAHCVRSHQCLSDPSVDLRGSRIELQREAGPHNARVHARVYLGVCTLAKPEHEPDVLGALMSFYGLPHYPEGYHPLDEGGES